MECNNKTSQYCGGKIRSCPLSGIGGNKCTVHTSQSNVQHKVSPAQKQVGWFFQMRQHLQYLPLCVRGVKTSIIQNFKRLKVSIKVVVFKSVENNIF